MAHWCTDVKKLAILECIDLLLEIGTSHLMHSCTWWPCLSVGGRAFGKDMAPATCVWNSMEGVPGTLLTFPSVSEVTCQSVISFTDLPCVRVCALSSHHLTHIPERVSPPPPFLFLMCECYLCRYKRVSYPSASLGDPWGVSELFWRWCAAAERTATAHVIALIRQWDGSKAKKSLRDKEVSPWLAHRRLPGAWNVHSHVLKREKREKDSEYTTRTQRNTLLAGYKRHIPGLDIDFEHIHIFGFYWLNSTPE